MEEVSSQNVPEAPEVIHILLCNAPLQLIHVYKSLMEYVAFRNGFKIHLVVHENGKEALFLTDDWNRDMDIILIGWESGDMKGIKAGEYFRKGDCKAEIIFFGEQSWDIVGSFKVNPFYYFETNEVTCRKFEQIMLTCLKKVYLRNVNSLYINYNGKMQCFPLENIMYIQIDHRIINLVLKDGSTVQFYESLKNLEEKITSDFFVRFNRGYMANLNYVELIDKNELYLNNGEHFPIGRYYRQSLMDKMIEQKNNILFL